MLFSYLFTFSAIRGCQPGILGCHLATRGFLQVSVEFCRYLWMLSSYPWISTGIRGILQMSVNVISVSVDVRFRVRLFSIILDTVVLHKLAHRPDSKKRHR